MQKNKSSGKKPDARKKFPKQNRSRAGLFAAALIVAASTPAPADNLQYSVNNLGGGTYQYDLTLSNSFNDPLSGLNMIFANTAFGLNDASVISAPAGWDFFAPLPPFVNELNWFSLTPATDIPVGGELGGFTFDSTTAPSSLQSDDFEYDVIDGRTGGQLTPERCSAIMLLATSLAALLAFGWRRGSNGLLQKGQL